MLADKIAVRSHVASLVGERYLKELYQTASDPDDIRFDLLPDAFVAKANNGSAMNILVRQKTLTDLDSIRKHLGLFLKRRIGRLKNEWWYEKIAPQVLIEKYLDIEFDYRFWVFHGVAQFVLAADSATGRLKKFDRDWQPQGAYALDESFNIPRPPRLDEMIEVAEALSSGLPFLRVDLFSPGDSEVVFGELSLAPGSGWTKRPEADDVLMGSFW